MINLFAALFFIFENRLKKYDYVQEFEYWGKKNTECMNEKIIDLRSKLYDGFNFL